MPRWCSAFAAATARAREGDLDGVEILGAFGLLVAAFMSPYSNTRQDEYGGSLDNRLRFAFEVIDAVREAAGPDRIVGMRIAGDELVEGGNDDGAMQEIAIRLEATGKLDYLNVIASNNLDRVYRAVHWPPTPAPHGLFVPLAAGIKKVVKLPVFTTGRIVDPDHAERILAAGQADMIGMTRAHIADPDLVRKISGGHAGDVRKCVGANVCIARVLAGGPVRCLHNPEAGREHEWGPAKPAVKPKRDRGHRRRSRRTGSRARGGGARPPGHPVRARQRAWRAVPAARLDPYLEGIPEHPGLAAGAA